MSIFLVDTYIFPILKYLEHTSNIIYNLISLLSQSGVSTVDLRGVLNFY